MKRLFLVSLSLLLLFSCNSVKVVSDYDTDTYLYYKDMLESTENRYNYVYYLYTGGDYENCITECDYALTLYPSYTRFLKLKALCLFERGERENYLSVMREILDKEPHDEELRNLYLEQLLEEGKTEEAIAFSKETIIYYPENKEAISTLASISQFYSYLDSLNQETTDTPIDGETSSDSVEQEAVDASVIEETSSDVVNQETSDSPL